MAILLSLAEACFAQGYIVNNGVVTNLFPNEVDLNWPAETQINGFEFAPVGITSGAYTNVFTFGEPATIGVRVFFVNSNQPITLDEIRSNLDSEISNLTDPIYPANPTNVINVNSPFYVALYSGAQLAQFYPSGNTNAVEYTDPVFGWAQLENVNGRINLLNSALEYQGGGIFAGTQNIISIPEPSELTLGVLGALLLGFRRRHP